MASKRRIRRNMCTGKRRYPDMTKAVAALIWIKKNLNDIGLTVYRCCFCRKYHLGHRGT